MGKRSDFERRETDFYRTPRAAVLPLIQHLRGSGIRSFAEPCAGDGALVRHLESFGLRCVYRDDIRNGHDTHSLDHYGAAEGWVLLPALDGTHHREYSALMRRQVEETEPGRPPGNMSEIGL